MISDFLKAEIWVAYQAYLTQDTAAGPPYEYWHTLMECANAQITGAWSVNGLTFVEVERLMSLIFPDEPENV